jgi:pimeloyl-ACP methyl ester carboxylesterase
LTHFSLASVLLLPDKPACNSDITWELNMIRRSDQARIESVQCISPDGLHLMAYKEWGEPDNPNVVMCVHGVTRVSDDFDVLARELSSEYRVVCPDVVGRGRSGWLRNPQHYQVPQYVSDIVTLIARIKAENLTYLGTSMGGMIGMGLASFKNTPVQKLILNDIGPVLNLPALIRIAHYVSQPVRFASFEEAATYIRTISQTFGEHTEDEWHKFCRDVLRQDKDGMWIRHYDLNIAMSMQAITPELAQAAQVMMWAAYDAITCPTLVLRGKESDLLLADTADQMKNRGPKAKLIEFEKVGHAPTLVHADQIEAVKKFLHT